MRITTMNLADPELELVDPTPNVHTLFIHFDREFFWAKLASRAVVRWSKRMYSCAGICSYEGRGGLCDIALSEPLLKLRPRKDLVETLLHEMIHAFLFVTNRDQDRDGHGPNFQAHMHRINKSAGLNISIYHSFHDEVKLYQTHWWRCNGPCQTLRPRFGIVRRTANRAPGPADYWWNYHKKQCGGTFIKIKEPENYKARKKTTDGNKKNGVTKSNGDITKYITNNIKTINSVSDTNNNGNCVLKDCNSNNKPSCPNTFVVTKKGVGFNPTVAKPQSQVAVFTGSGHTIDKSKQHISDHRNVTEHVRNIWANKEIPTAINEVVNKKVETTFVKNPDKIAGISNPNKHKAKDLQSPPAKIKKIDEYFKATSLLKDLYGEDFKLTQNNKSTKLVAVAVSQDLVDCPTCNAKVDSRKINEHLDECLNKDIIKQLSQENEPVQAATPSRSNLQSNNLTHIVDNIPPIEGKLASPTNNFIDLTYLNNFDTDSPKITSNKGRRRTDSPTAIESVKVGNVTSLTNKIDSKINRTIQVLDSKKPVVNNKRKSSDFITKNRDNNLPSAVKIEPALKEVEETNEIQPGPSTSKESNEFVQICPCCGNKFDKTVDEHLDECLVFSQDNNEYATTSVSNNTAIVIEDDDNDIFDESQELNATGTKTPCPCCMEMVEEVTMNDHLDSCLGLTQC